MTRGPKPRLSDHDAARLHRMRSEGASTAALASEFGLTVGGVWGYLRRGPEPRVPTDAEATLPVWSLSPEDARMLRACLEHGMTDGARLLGLPRGRVQSRLRFLIGGDSVAAMIETAMHLGWLRFPESGVRVPCCEHRCGLDEPGRHDRPPEPFPHRPIALVPPARA